MNFTVPIQKDTEREIFDYIDLDSIKESLDRINAKYDDEDLSNDIWEIEIPSDNMLAENVNEVEMNSEENGEVEYNGESSETEYSNINEEVNVSESDWGEVESLEEN